jgi:hypothetical protein
MCNLYRLRARPGHVRELLGYVEEPVIVAARLHRDRLVNEGVEADRMIAAVQAHPDPSLIVEPVELERRAAVPKPSPAETDQLSLF